MDLGRFELEDSFPENPVSSQRFGEIRRQCALADERLKEAPESDFDLRSAGILACFLCPKQAGSLRYSRFNRPSLAPDAVLVVINASHQPNFPMLIVHVHVQVKPECVEAFKAATLANARPACRNPGSPVSMSASRPTIPRGSCSLKLSHAGGARRAQGHGALCRMARRRRLHDGGAPHQREIRQHVPRRPRLVKILAKTKSYAL